MIPEEFKGIKKRNINGARDTAKARGRRDTAHGAAYSAGVAPASKAEPDRGHGVERGGTDKIGLSVRRKSTDNLWLTVAPKCRKWWHGQTWFVREGCKHGQPSVDCGTSAIRSEEKPRTAKTRPSSTRGTRVEQPPQIRSLNSLPRRPSGRTRRTRIMIRKAKVFLKAMDT
jgi:hypothetical protein